MNFRVGAASAVVLAALAAGSAQAADLIVDDVAVAAATTGVDWSGAYVGGSLGFVSGTVDWFVPGPDFGDSYGVSGWSAGVQGGYNWQMDSVVFGIEGDIALGGIEGDEDDFGGPIAISRTINWTASLRGRVGYAWDSILFYATGGLAAANSTGSVSAFILNDDVTNTHVGWTVGAGIEAMVTDNVSLKAEYSYADYGTETYTYFGGLDVETGFTTHTFKVGANFHF